MTQDDFSDKDQRWRDIVHLLRVTFGESHIHNQPDVIHVNIDHSDPAQQQLYFMLAEVVGDKLLDNVTHNAPSTDGKIWTPDTHGDVEITLKISKGQNPDALLEKLLDKFGNQRRSKEGGRVELHLPSQDSLFVYDLERLTGCAWRKVLGGKYGRPVMEPVLRDRPSDEQREKQELLLAEAAIPRHPTVEARNWLEHQREVEHETGTGPRTAMPADLLSPDRRDVASRLSRNSYSERLREELRAAFEEKDEDRGRS